MAQKYPILCLLRPNVVALLAPRSGLKSDGYECIEAFKEVIFQAPLFTLQYCT